MQRAKLFVVHLLQAGLEAQSTLLQLAKLLIAHSHIVKNLESYILVASAPRKVDHVEDTVRLLKQEQSVLELLLLYVDQSTLV